MIKCCSKGFVALAVAAGLGIAVVSATGVAPALWERAKSKFEKQIPPEVQIEQLRLDISKLEKDMEKNWSLIAQYDIDVKNLDKELVRKQEKVKSMEKDLAAAADELDAKTKFVKYGGQEYTPSQARSLLEKETNLFVSLKKEVASKEKLLGARKQKLASAMSTQKEMKSQQQDLMTQVGLLEADLETLKLMRTESKLPDGERNRLDKIKIKLNKLQNVVEVEKRANELREAANGGTVTSEPKIDSSENVVKRIRDAVGNNNVAKDDN